MLVIRCFTLLLLLVSFTGHAQSSREFRSNHSLGIDLVLSPVSLPVPGSKGAAIYMSTGIEVNFSKLDLAGFHEKNIGLKARRFYGNSFNLSFGFVRRTNEVYLDPSVYGISVSDVKYRTEAHANLLHLGMSNHWQFDNWSLAVNWISLNLPLGGKVRPGIPTWPPSP